MKLYRVMKVDADGLPMIGTRRNMLGVRPTDPTNTNPKRKFDVDAVIGSDPVLPGTKKGLSVSVATGGFQPTRDEALWEVEDDLLADFAAIPDRPPHHVLEPRRAMTLDEYQDALAATQYLWDRVP